MVDELPCRPHPRAARTRLPRSRGYRPECRVHSKGAARLSCADAGASVESHGMSCGGPPRRTLRSSESQPPREGGAAVEYVGIDWSYRRAAWCALSDAGAIVGEGAVSSDEDGLARLVIKRGTEVRAVVEMMSGA